jgi:hypothetical protein
MFEGGPMGYYVDYGIVTDKKGIDTLWESAAVKDLRANNDVKLFRIDPDGVFYLKIENMKYGYLESIGLFEVIKQLEYHETLLIGEDVEDVEHRLVCPESMTKDIKYIPRYYLSCKRTMEVMCLIPSQYNTPNTVVKIENP